MRPDRRSLLTFLALAAALAPRAAATEATLSATPAAAEAAFRRVDLKSQQGQALPYTIEIPQARHPVTPARRDKDDSIVLL